MVIRVFALLMLYSHALEPTLARIGAKHRSNFASKRSMLRSHRPAQASRCPLGAAVRHTGVASSERLRSAWLQGAKELHQPGVFHGLPVCSPSISQLASAMAFVSMSTSAY